ncbi:hypothetical protein BDK51DRAFT_48831 [Blyttiomyces helicus]|uniref:Uncharacterized protein n=1 Tax=Blyttiomyces helicus TaxID=388810 RepID=A0A4P9W3A6_9FUNG|nr:hypothetical protein BDK51DRAFT_48831 [Blyttiomyces helicus]|eukprot:RKO84596.1 hypothetical protein BDK51DRAFT_48831 [Blyttiomyces helicus]
MSFWFVTSSFSDLTTPVPPPHSLPVVSSIPAPFGKRQRADSMQQGKHSSLSRPRWGHCEEPGQTELRYVLRSLLPTAPLPSLRWTSIIQVPCFALHFHASFSGRKAASIPYQCLYTIDLVSPIHAKTQDNALHQHPPWRSPRREGLENARRRTPTPGGIKKSASDEEDDVHPSARPSNAVDKTTA